MSQQGTSRLLQFGGGAVGIIFMPIMIVIALLFASLSNLEEAQACAPVGTGEPAKFVYPVSNHDGRPTYMALKPVLIFPAGDREDVHAVAAGRVSISGDQVRLKVDDTETPRPTDGSGELFVTLGGFSRITVPDGSHVDSNQVIGQASGQLLMSVVIDGHDTNPMDFLEDRSQQGGSGCGCGGAGGAQLVGTNNQQKVFNYFVGKGYTKEQAAGIIGNMIAESGVLPKRLQDTPSSQETSAQDAERLAPAGSRVGWGIVQWTPAATMIGHSRRAGKSYDEIGTLEWQVEFLYKQLTGDSPMPEVDPGDRLKRAHTVEEATVAFAGFERFQGWEDPNNPKYRERMGNAREVLRAFGGGGPGTPAGGENGCMVTGDIAQQALQLAWPNKDEGGVDRHGILKEDATEAYQQAMPRYNPGPSRASNYPWTDCGVFTATVIRMTFDPNYQERGTGEQRRYVTSHPEKFQIINNPQSTADVQPGDIMIGDGHTYMYTGPYTGDDGKNYNSAAASWATEAGKPSGRVPMADRWYNDGTYIAARPKRG